MKVLLTGAAGFIGSHLARLLVKQDYEVYALIRPTTDLWRIQDTASSLNFIRCDLLDKEVLSKELDSMRPDIAIHLAWYVIPGLYLNSLKNLDSFGTSLNLVTKLGEVGCKRILIAGTCFEYDTDLGFLSETSSVRPRSLYASSKLALYLMAKQLVHLMELELVWVRLFYLYGPFEDEKRLIPHVICSLLRNETINTTAGQQIRDYLHVEDIASAIWAVALSSLTDTVNIGSGYPVSIRQLVGEVGELLGKSNLIHFGGLPYRANDPMFICANNKRLLEHTSWKPRFDIHSGLKHTIKWWENYMKRRS